MRALFWILRVLAVLLLVRLIVNAVMGARRRASASPHPPRSPRERALGELVRDPHCGTYVPKASAVVAGSGDNRRYFCSTKCRDEHERT